MTKRTAWIALGVLAAAAAAATSLVFGQPKTGQPSTPPQTQPTGASNVQLQRGRYLVALGDCVACHTQKGGARFAGGRPVQTPYGTILSANITPDQDTGIGGWTPDQFYRALHEGIDDEGKHLYPAFPYNYYTGVTREDSDAMFAYLRSQQPVRHDFERNKLPFPYNQRWLMVFWNWLFLHKGPMQADASKSPQWNRGAYLVQALGHCEACHTAKNFLGGPENGANFRGGSFGTWYAPDITANQRTGIGAWSDDELREFLRRGLNVHSDASGEMGEMVSFSSSQMTDDDLNAVITYLRGVPASPTKSSATPDAAVMKEGQAIWQDTCSACHRMDASGVPRYFPPLAHDAFAQQNDPTSVIHYILAGARHVPTDKGPTPLSMPAYDWKLDDQQVAAVATFVRNSWGNTADPVSADQVKKLRAQLHFDQMLPAESLPVKSDMAHPGPNTLAPAGTDSRDNGTAQAGRAAPSNDTLPTAAASAAAGGGQAAAAGASGSGGPTSAAGASGSASGSATAASGANGGQAAQGSGGSGGQPQGGGGKQQEHGKGHPAGVPTPGPG